MQPLFPGPQHQPLVRLWQGQRADDDRQPQRRAEHEDRTPVERRRDEAPDDGCDDGADEERDEVEAHGGPALVGGKHVRDNPLLAGIEAAAVRPPRLRRSDSHL